jgi:hypothetical protein
VTAGAGVVTAGQRTEPYGRVAVFLDIAGNKWDLIGPPPPLVTGGVTGGT